MFLYSWVCVLQSRHTSVCQFLKDMILKWNYSANKSFLLLLKFIWVISGKGKSKESACCCQSKKHSGQRDYLSPMNCTSKSFIIPMGGGCRRRGENIIGPNCTVLVSVLCLPWKEKSPITRAMRVNWKVTFPAGVTLGAPPIATGQHCVSSSNVTYEFIFSLFLSQFNFKM
jgi:hypothetical protein